MYHVRIDARKVQDFIFRLPKLKTMLGANSLIGEFFAFELPKLRGMYPSVDKLTLAAQNLSKSEISKLEQAREEFPFDDPLSLFAKSVICSAGGHFEALFERPSDVKSFTFSALKTVREKLPGLQISVTAKEFNPSCLFDDFLSAEVFPAVDDVAYVAHPDSPWWRISEDGTMPASMVSGGGRKKEFVSQLVKRLEKQAGLFYENKTFDFLAPVNKRLGAFRSGSQDNLESLAKASTLFKKNMIALISIDGNGMGKRFKTVRDGLKKNSIMDAMVKMELFWYNERKRMRSALIKAIGAQGENTTLPYLLFMLGGDDLLLASTPEHAFDFVREFNNSYSLGGSSASFSAGIAFVKYSYPIAHAVALSQSLLESAKVKSKTGTGNECCVDWHVLTDSRFRDIESIRTSEYMVSYKSNKKEICELYSARPYSIDEAYEQWIIAAKIAKQCNLQDGKGRNNLKRFRYYLRAGKVTSIQWGKMLDLDENLYCFKKVKDGETEVYVNNALDSIELIDFHK